MRPALTRALILLVIALLIGSYFWFDLGQYFSLDELRARRDQLQLCR